VVVGQAIHVVLEGVEARCGEESHLAHAAAEQLARAVDAPDDGGVAAHERAHRSAETLRQAERRGVEGLGPDVGRSAGRDHGVEQPRAVQVQGQAALAGRGGDVLDRV
jgi:hypothetical protein